MDFIILAVLKQYHVEVDILDVAGWNVVDIVSPIESRRTPPITFPFPFRQIKFKRGLGKVVKIVAVNMPGQNPQLLFIDGLVIQEILLRISITASVA